MIFLRPSVQAVGRAASEVEVDAPARSVCCLTFFWGEGREVAGNIWRVGLSPRACPEPRHLKGQDSFPRRLWFGEKEAVQKVDLN